MAAEGASASPVTAEQLEAAVEVLRSQILPAVGLAGQGRAKGGNGAGGNCLQMGFCHYERGLAAAKGAGAHHDIAGSNLIQHYYRTAPLHVPCLRQIRSTFAGTIAGPSGRGGTQPLPADVAMFVDERKRAEHALQELTAAAQVDFLDTCA